MRAVLGGVLAAGLLASPTFAHSSSSAWNGLSDRFQIETGYFRITGDTVLRYSGGQGSGDIDFEKDRGVNSNEHARTRLHLGRRDLQRRALGDDDVGHRHPGRLLPPRPRPERALRTSTMSTATTAGSWSASWAATSRPRASRCSLRSCSRPGRAGSHADRSAARLRIPD